MPLVSSALVPYVDDPTESVTMLDDETVVLDYPSCFAKEASYFTERVRMEFGTRNRVVPSRSRVITPSVTDFVTAEEVDLPRATVDVLSAARTFWEKATLGGHEGCEPEPSGGRAHCARCGAAPSGCDAHGPGCLGGNGPRGTASAMARRPHRGRSRSSSAAPARFALGPTARTYCSSAPMRLPRRDDANAAGPACRLPVTTERSLGPRCVLPGPKALRSLTRTGTTATGPSHRNAGWQKRVGQPADHRTTPRLPPPPTRPPRRADTTPKGLGPILRRSTSGL